MGDKDFSQFSKEILNQRFEKLNLIDLRDSIWISIDEILIETNWVNFERYVEERFEIRMGKL